MPKRENISIKTKYKTKADCMENCRDVKRITRLSLTYSRQITGEVYPDGRFELNSRARGNAMFEFKGIIKEEADGIYMVGDIIKKPSAIKMVVGSIVLSMIVAFGLVMTINPVFMFFALLFATIPWLNLWILNNSDDLYKDIVNKVG